VSPSKHTLLSPEKTLNLLCHSQYRLLYKICFEGLDGRCRWQSLHSCPNPIIADGRQTVTNRIIDSAYEAYDGKPGLPRYPEITGLVEANIEVHRLNTVVNTVTRIVDPSGAQEHLLWCADQSKENFARVSEILKAFKGFNIDGKDFLSRLTDGKAWEMGKDETWSKVEPKGAQ